MLRRSRRRADAVYGGQSRRRPHRLVAQDTALSRRRHGFESRWGHARKMPFLARLDTGQEAARAVAAMCWRVSRRGSPAAPNISSSRSTAMQMPRWTRSRPWSVSRRRFTRPSARVGLPAHQTAVDRGLQHLGGNHPVSARVIGHFPLGRRLARRRGQPVGGPPGLISGSCGSMWLACSLLPNGLAGSPRLRVSAAPS